MEAPSAIIPTQELTEYLHSLSFSGWLLTSLDVRRIVPMSSCESAKIIRSQAIQVNVKKYENVIHNTLANKKDRVPEVGVNESIVNL